MNDRFAVVGPQAAQCYFQFPFLRYFDDSALPLRTYNSETHLHKSYADGGCGNLQIDERFNPIKFRDGKALNKKGEGI